MTKFDNGYDLVVGLPLHSLKKSFWGAQYMTALTDKLKAWLPSDMKLADQHVEAGREQWFARTRLNVIDWYPQAALNLICMGLLIFAAGHQLGMVFCIVAAFVSPLPTIGVGLLYDRMRSIAEPDHVKILKHRSNLVVVNALVWACLFGWAISAASGWPLIAVLALALYRLVLTGQMCLSIPYHGTLAMAILAAGAGAGMIVGGGWAGAIGAVIVALMAHSLYSIVFNLYYMFATRRLRTRTLREANETVQILLSDYDENASDWLWHSDENGYFVDPSRRFADAAGMSQGDLAKLRIGNLAEHAPELHKLYAMVKNEHSFRNHRLKVTINGETRWWATSGKPLRDASGKMIGYRGFASDVTEVRAAEEQISYMAHYDILTGLGNRAMFSHELHRALERRRDDEVVAVLYVDLDHFKSVNDGFGHGIGDQVLATAARRIEAELGQRDVAARLGGDEFSVVVPRAISTDDVLKLAQKIVDSICQPMQLDRLTLQIGCSVGVAFGPHDAGSPEALLRCADLALYHAKEQGRGCLSAYDRDMHEAMQDRRQLTSDLRLAVNRGELELYYQPLVEVKTGKTQGYEALLRWNHPERGLVSPADFIPIAEETGLIVPIGEWVIRTGLDELARWPDHLSLAVNLSPVQIRSENLLPLLVQALATTGVDPGRFELEITESVLLHDSDDNVATLHKLKALGLRIALDDFGTGYSSLNYLRCFPFDKIKIDRSFVDQLKDRPENQAIVDAVVGLANNLHMATTAEGVECEEQLEELKRNGCVQAQGFYFQRPRPAEALSITRIESSSMRMASSVVAIGSPAEQAKDEPEIKRARAPRRRKRA